MHIHQGADALVDVPARAVTAPDEAQKRVLEELDQFRGDKGAPDMTTGYFFDCLQNNTVAPALIQ